MDFFTCQHVKSLYKPTDDICPACYPATFVPYKYAVKKYQSIMTDVVMVTKFNHLLTICSYADINSLHITRMCVYIFQSMLTLDMPPANAGFCTNAIYVLANHPKFDIIKTVTSMIEATQDIAGIYNHFFKLSRRVKYYGIMRPSEFTAMYSPTRYYNELKNRCIQTYLCMYHHTKSRDVARLIARMLWHKHYIKFD